jgi:hypothetical protein
MGEIADMMIEGDMCPCGEYIGDGAGFTQYCSETCAREFGGHTVAEPPVHRVARDTPCPYCSKKTRGQDGLQEHIRVKHRDALLRDALEMILPMAKGYAYDHQVGANMEKIAHAEALLAETP